MIDESQSKKRHWYIHVSFVKILDWNSFKDITKKYVITTNWITSKLLYCISNQIFHYTRYITPKRVTSLRGPYPRHCARVTQLLSKKCRSGGELLVTLYPIWPAWDLNLRPPDPETNALPLDHLAGLHLTFKIQEWRKSFYWNTLSFYSHFIFFLYVLLCCCYIRLHLYYIIFYTFYNIQRYCISMCFVLY